MNFEISYTEARFIYEALQGSRRICELECNKWWNCDLETVSDEMGDYIDNLTDYHKNNLAVIDHLCSRLDVLYDLSSDLAPVAKGEQR